jgi:hypothetical protein
MTTEQREKLRGVLIDYLEVLTSEGMLYNTVSQDNKISQVRLLLKEVAW